MNKESQFEKIKTSEVSVETASPGLEFNLIWEACLYYKENKKYTKAEPLLPESIETEFKKRGKNVSEKDKGEFFKLFEAEYVEPDYSAELKQIEDNKFLVNEVIERMKKIAPDCKVVDKYHIILRKYGLFFGRAHKGSNTISFRQDSKDFKEGIVHEMLHLVIGDLARKYHIDDYHQKNEERLVELLMMSFFKDYLPNYQPYFNLKEHKDRGDKELDDFINSNLNNLEKAFKEYAEYKKSKQ